MYYAHPHLREQREPTGSADMRPFECEHCGQDQLGEADDAKRERRRGDMSEPYRTLLGHFRHETGQYYWDRLVRNCSRIEDFRGIFGDERQDYASALPRHHENGPPRHWPERYLSAYASAHPREDFAESWAHYFHTVDTLETAAAFGVNVQPGKASHANLSAVIDFDPHFADLDLVNRRVVAARPLGQLDQPQHGSAGSVSVRSRAPGNRQAGIHSRTHP
jgi:hypothetical protein